MPFSEPNNRVAMIVHGMAGGGLERAVRDLTLQVRERGYEAGVFATGHLGLYFEELAERGIPVFDCRSRGVRLPGLSLPLLRALAGFQPSIIHAHSGTILPSALSRFLLRRPRMVFTDHGRYPEPRWVALVERLCLTQVARYIAVADELGDHVAEHLSLPERPTIIANGIDLTPYQRPPAQSRETLRRQWGVREDQVLLMSVGRLMAVKNHALLLDALADACAVHSTLCAALIGDGVLEDSLRTRAATLGIDSRLHWLGFRKDVSDCLRAADIFVISSDSEGLPLVLLEAMAAGLPVVSTEVGGIPRALGESAILVPPKDKAALAGALGRLAAGAELRRQLGASNRARSSQFSLEAMVERYVALYDGLRRDPAAPARARARVEEVES